MSYVGVREIPEGMYGSGRVEIWDKGSLRVVRRESALIEFELKGGKMAGDWVLVRMKGQDKNWLLVRKKTKLS